MQCFIQQNIVLGAGSHNLKSIRIVFCDLSHVKVGLITHQKTTVRLMMKVIFFLNYTSVFSTNAFETGRQFSRLREFYRVTHLIAVKVDVAHLKFHIQRISVLFVFTCC